MNETDDLCAPEPRGPRLLHAADYTVRMTVADGTCAIQVCGSVDWHAAPALRGTLLERAARVPTTVVDLSGLTFADSALLHVLLDVQRHCRASGARLVIDARLQPVLARLFTVTGASAYFEFGDR
ncbi:STAS domain-containing protein [Streptomyces tropicalis]|uniref:STAS domain-containing protein n=1 Tax=Streptomyces tropicalis TaxID=3034234 RepID=A0ABT6A9R8_9ACTN|nr:STAS domain-containing protein [Streptomyces tropicalis]MDF3301397.1 STAS domain-containing protein [Streptomyces tropicalis]